MQTTHGLGSLYAPKASARTESFSPSAKPNPRQTQSRSQENASRAQTSRGVRTTHPAVTPGVGLTSTRHVRDTPPGKCSVELEVEECALWVPEVPECAQERERPFVQVHDMRFARLRMQGSKSSFFRHCSFALQGLFLCPSPGAKWVPLCLLRKKTSLGLLLVACWRRVCVDRGATGVNGFADTSVRTGPGPKLQRVFFRGMRLMKKKHVSGAGERFC